MEHEQFETGDPRAALEKIRSDEMRALNNMGEKAFDSASKLKGLRGGKYVRAVLEAMNQDSA